MTRPVRSGPRRGAVAGPARRLWRDRPRVVAVALLAVAVVAASVLQTTSATVLQQTLDENWRGSYDILVTQGGKDPVTGGLLQSDALVDATIGRLSLADLAAVRAVPGVAVAAPIGEVTFPGGLDSAGSARVWLPVPVRADASLEHPEAFRITVTSTVDDGVAPRELATQTVLAFAYQPSYSQVVFDTNGAPLLDSDGQKVYATHDLADSPRLLSADTRAHFVAGPYDAASGTIPLGLFVDPRPASTVVLVDPEAERALLGDAGAFLDPLIAHTASPGSVSVVTLDRAPTAIPTTVTVEEFDSVVPGVDGAEAVAQAQGTGSLQNGQIAPKIEDDGSTTEVGSYSLDLSSATAPFANELALLGGVSAQAAAANDSGSGTGVPRSVVTGQYTVPDTVKDDGTGLRLAARGYASLGQYFAAPLSGSAVHGSVTDYVKLFGAVSQAGLADAHFDVVGSYTPEQLRAAGDAGYTPLGGYDVSAPSVVAGPDGAATTARPLATSITGFGIPGTNALAVGSFAMLDGLGVDRPISAIRVKVAGITGYTAEAQRRLLAVASDLGSLGLHVTVVAGSSPQRLPVLVTGYAGAGTDASGGQVIGDLGYIEQDWSRLGAVTQVDAAVSATSVALLAVSVVAVGVLLAAVQLGSIPARRATAGVLRELGWRRRRIVGWNLSVEAVALALLAAVGAAAVASSSVRLVAGLAVGLAIALVIVTSLVAVVAGSRGRAGRRRARLHFARPRIHGPIAFGARLARTQLGPSLALGLALLLLTVSAAVAATVFVQGRQLAGPTLLGAVASARGWLPQGVLAAVCLAAGVVLAVIARRMGTSLRRQQWAAVRAMGWSTAQVTRAQLAELAFSAVPGAALGVLAALGVAVQLPGILLPVLASSVIAAVCGVAVVLLSGRKLD